MLWYFTQIAVSNTEVVQIFFSIADFAVARLGLAVHVRRGETFTQVSERVPAGRLARPQELSPHQATLHITAFASTLSPYSARTRRNSPASEVSGGHARFADHRQVK